MARSVKLKAYEQVTPENIRKVLALLEAGGTKREACTILSITYNTSRLQRILDEYVRRDKVEKELRARKRGTPVELEEALQIIKEYLETASVDAVSKAFYRSRDSINRVLDTYGAKLYGNKGSYFNPSYLPDQCVVSELQEGQYVWAARYNMLAKVRKEETPGVYVIRVYGKYSRDSYQEIDNLGSLKHLEDLGLDLGSINFYERERSNDEED